MHKTFKKKHFDTRKMTFKRNIKQLNAFARSFVNLYKGISMTLTLKS